MNLKTYNTFLILTIGCFFALVLAGATVRATGSGLGCPDWPKCFGQYIPPMSESELPANYQELFKIQGKSIAPFSAFKTWTEYLNRLLGAVAGVFVLGLLISSWLKRNEPGVSFPLCLSLFILVGFQGFLGSVVVSSNLAPYMITFHMLLAMVVTCLAFEIYIKTHAIRIPLPDSLKNSERTIKWHLMTIFALSILQLVLGTRVREKVDTWMHNPELLEQDLWFSNLSPLVDIHRNSAIILIIITILFIRNLQKNAVSFDSLLMKTAGIPFFCLGLSYVSGVLFKHWNFPHWNQPVHLFLAAILISASYFNMRTFKFNND